MIDNPRVDLVIATYGRSLLIALVVIGVLAVGATGWAVANPPSTTTTEETAEETVATDVGTSAIVVEDGLWDSETELEDRPLYLRNATPNLTLTPRTTVPTDDATVTHAVTVRYAALRDGDQFWNESTEVLRTDAPVENGTATSAVTLDVGSLADRQRQLEREIEDVGSIRLTIDLAVAYDTGTYADEQAASTPLSVTDRAYWLEDALSPSRTHTSPTRVEVTRSRSPALVGGLALLGVASLGAAGVVSRRRSIDVETARRRVHEHRYAEWISHGSFPMWIGEHHIALDTLEDVVDVAIDTKKRVVHDRQRDLFAVVSDDVVYYYSDSGLWEETAWPKMDLDDDTAVPPEVEANQPSESDFPGSDPTESHVADADGEESDATDDGPRSSDGLPDVDEDEWRQL